MIQNKILSPNSTELSVVLHIYELSFPIDERRDTDAVLSLVENEKRFTLEAVCDDNRVVGFISWWNFTDWRYVEHFAIDESLRGRGIGHEVLREFLSRNSTLVVLEVEPPIDVDSCRRVAFYRSLGFVLHNDFTYIQPSYGAGRASIELRLMSCGDGNSFDCSCVEKILHRVVYGVL